MTRSITCKSCNTQFTADLSHAPSNELTVACPKCGQRYKLRTATTNSPPAAKSATQTAAALNQRQSSRIPIPLAISAGVAALGTFLPWLTTGASASVEGIGSYSTSFGSSAGIGLWHGELAFIAALASLFFFWKGQPRKAGFIALAIPLVCVLGGLHASSAFNVGSSFGGASFHGSSSPGIGLFISALAGIATSVFAFRGSVLPVTGGIDSAMEPTTTSVGDSSAAVALSSTAPFTPKKTVERPKTTVPKPVKPPFQVTNKARISIIICAATTLIGAATWFLIELSQRHTLTEAERAQAEGWFQDLRSQQWVLVSSADASKKEYQLTAQPLQVSADSYGKTKIRMDVELLSTTSGARKHYGAVEERQYTELSEPREIFMTDGNDVPGEGTSIMLRRITRDSIVVEFRSEDGVGDVLAGIPEERFATLQAVSESARRLALIHTVDSMMQNGGLLRRGIFQSYACGDECVASFLITTNGQPVPASYVCNNNRFGELQLSQGNMIGEGDFTNQALVGRSFLFVTQRSVVDTEAGDKAALEVVTGMLPMPDEITPELQQRLAVASNVDVLTSAQGNAAAPIVPANQFLSDGEVYDLNAVQEQPMFPGGMERMYEYMGRMQKYPDAEYEAGIQGKVTVQFTVDKDGSIREVKLLRGVSEGLDQEALRIVRSMPKWIPGKLDGRPVKCRFNLPIMFRLK